MTEVVAGRAGGHQIGRDASCSHFVWVKKMVPMQRPGTLVAAQSEGSNKVRSVVSIAMNVSILSLIYFMVNIDLIYHTLSSILKQKILNIASKA